MAWNIFEASAMTPDERLDWSASVLILRAAVAGDDRFSGDAKLSFGRSRAAYPKWLPKDGDGPIFLGGELNDMGIKTRSTDRDAVYWKDSKGKFVQVGRDWGDYKKRIRDLLRQYGMEDPRADETARAWAVALSLVSVAAGIAIAASGGDPGSAEAATTAGTAASGLLYAEADRAESEFSSSAAGYGQEVSVTGSSQAQGIATAGAGLIGAIGSSVEAGEVDAAGISQAAAGLYQAATGTTTAPPTTAPATVPATTGESAFIAWAKSTPGMIILGAGALFLIYKLAGRR